MVRERHNVAFLVGVICGAAGAATAALFYTPLSGMETRQQLNARLRMLRQRVGARVAALRGDSEPESTGLFGA